MGDQKSSLRHPVAGVTSLVLVRHGRTDSNVNNLLHGQTDVPLDSLGIRQAHAVAHRLSGETRSDCLLTSPLSRAVETARIIGSRIGLVPQLIPGLVEINFGDLEGTPIDHFLMDHAPLAVRMMDENDIDVGWPGGETRREFRDRVFLTFLDILSSFPNHRVIIVAHGGVIGTIISMVMGIDSTAVQLYDVVNCSVSHLEVTPTQTVLHCRNDVVHLELITDVFDDSEVAG